MTEQEEQLMLMAGYHERMDTFIYRRPDPNLFEMIPNDRLDYILNKWPELKKPYNYSSIIHVGLDGLSHAPDAHSLLEIAKHILVNYDKANSMLMKAMEQGFKPQD